MQRLGFTLLFLAPLTLSGCDKPKPQAPKWPDDVSMRSGPLDWCDVFMCTPCREGHTCPPGHQVSWCCDSSGGCVEVADGTTCPSGEVKVICYWGITNEDGTMECFDPQ